MTQVQTTLLALASMVYFDPLSCTGNTVKLISYESACVVFMLNLCNMHVKCVIFKTNFITYLQAKTKGLDTKVDIGVKYADKQERHFDDDKMKAGQCVIGLQVRQASSSAAFNI